MFEFLHKYRHLLVGLLILFVALQIPIYWKQDRSLGFAGRLLYTLAYYPQLFWTGLHGGVAQTFQRYVILVGVEEENIILRERNAELEREMARLAETDRENDRLRALLAMRERNQYEAVGARLIAFDSSSWYRSFTIDAGTRNGLERGMPVVTQHGLVGTVVSVSSRSAKILPIVDIHSAVEVVSARSRARGILVGRGRERAFIDYLERSEDLRVGDVLITSGLGGLMPEGIPVAVVKEVRHQPHGLFQEAYAETLVRFNRLENLLVLRYQEGDEMPAYVPPATAPSIPDLPPPVVAASEAEPETVAEVEPPARRPGSELVPAMLTAPSPEEARRREEARQEEVGRAREEARRQEEAQRREREEARRRQEEARRQEEIRRAREETRKQEEAQRREAAGRAPETSAPPPQAQGEGASGPAPDTTLPSQPGPATRGGAPSPVTEGGIAPVTQPATPNLQLPSGMPTRSPERGAR